MNTSILDGSQFPLVGKTSLVDLPLELSARLKLTEVIIITDRGNH